MIILIISDRKSITGHLIDAITDFVDHEVMSLTSSECTPVKLSTLKNIDLIIHDINQLTNRDISFHCMEFHTFGC